MNSLFYSLQGHCHLSYLLYQGFKEYKYTVNPKVSLYLSKIIYFHCYCGTNAVIHFFELKIYLKVCPILNEIWTVAG